MRETPAEVEDLQRLLDGSAAAAGPHMSGIITPDRRLTAQQLRDHYLSLQGRSFAEWLERTESLAVQIVAEKMFTFAFEPAG